MPQEETRSSMKVVLQFVKMERLKRRSGTASLITIITLAL
jgi:hypothetical protein